MVSTDPVNGKRRRDAAIAHLEANINQRMVRGGNFKVVLEDNGKGGTQMKDITFNKSCVWVLLAPPEAFDCSEDEPYHHLFDNVLPTYQFSETLPRDLQTLLMMETNTITEFELQRLIWFHLFQMYTIVRKDPKPLLKEGAQEGSLAEDDYHFGVPDEEITKYIHHADLFHRLVLFR